MDVQAIVRTVTLALLVPLAPGPAPAARTAAQTAPDFSIFYFDTLGYTERWVDLIPPPREGEAVSPITLNITIRHAGKPPAAGRPDQPPTAIIVRADSNPQFNPMFIRQPILVMQADDVNLWDQQQPVNFYSRNATPCEGCSTSADVVDLRVPEDVLRRMAGARRIAGNAFGMTFELGPEQIETIARFVGAVLGPL